jgi:hypothetical protein
MGHGGRGGTEEGSKKAKCVLMIVDITRDGMAFGK